jgi:hypothetical protein
MKSIFGLQEEYVNIASEMEAHFHETGSDELPEHIHDRLVINRNEMAEKLERYKYLIDEWEGDIDTLDKKIKSLILRKGSIAKSVERLKGYISDALELYGEAVVKKGVATGSVRFAGLEFTVTKIRTKPVIVEAAEEIPRELKDFAVSLSGLTWQELLKVQEFIVIKEAQLWDKSKVDLIGTPRKKDIKAVIEKGEQVSGARIDEQASYLKFT